MSSRIALITGASKGVGRGIAYGMADAGWDIVINYHSDAAGADETRTVIEGKGRRCFTISGDVGKKGDVEDMFAAIVAEFGGLIASSTTPDARPGHLFSTSRKRIGTRRSEPILRVAFSVLRRRLES